MLVLSRKVGEEIVIGGNIRLKVLSIRGNQIRLGFTAPEDVLIHREELVRGTSPNPEKLVAAPPSPMPRPDAIVVTPTP